ncbi:FeoB-associated Cys-rich membrane protein [Xanthocytophaga agilis]|uniref:FeoB-associated Cys-rich membrane protein n=1 Tax=Xanthocytophaga agilis TaxID=3048010 RepID=A0AAE3UG88_9BACT|nr:FeoB-associated Cys-rich membrane protein [Xanthocytophaga agilis]MDJ1504150.1 FeoB-associated Cys-rich membrane protein [Xanthocytophaga agilis]
MAENIIIGIIFFSALVYLFTVVRKQFSTKSTGCAKGCGGACSTIDFKKIEAEMQKNKQTI